MARYELDELEADEVYHSLMGRKMDLDARAKSLSEKDGLPEAAEAVRKRIEIYMPNGEGPKARPGLLRLFAPQRDLDAERHAAQEYEGRDANGGQDLFGGGAETGGRKRGKKRGDDEPAVPTEPAAESPSETASGEPTEFVDPIEVALDQLAALAVDLLKGEALIEPDIYRGYAVPVLDLLPKANPAIDTDFLRSQVNDVFRETPDNAQALGIFVQRNVDLIRDARERPIGRREEAHQAETPGVTNEPAEHETSPISDQSLADVNVATTDGASHAGLNFGAETADKKKGEKPKGKPKR